MQYKKLIRVAIIGISLILAYLLYRSEYNIKPEKSHIEKAIEEFIEKDITVIDFKKVHNVLAVYYTFGDREHIGFAPLYRGINFRYQIRGASYDTKNVVIKGYPFETNQGHYLAVVGINYDYRIDKIDVETQANEKLTIDLNYNRDIFEVIKTKEESYFVDYTLYDIDEQDITEEMRKYLTYRDGSGSSRFKAELFMLYVFCFIILLAGYGISRLFTVNSQGSIIKKMNDSRVDK